MSYTLFFQVIPTLILFSMYLGIKYYDWSLSVKSILKFSREFLSFFKNTCGDLDPGVLYFVNFRAFNNLEKKNETLCKIFTVSGVITG